MRRLRTRLIFAFAASTLVPVAITSWVSLSLLNHSLEYNAIRELDETSRALEQTGRDYYHAARALLRQKVAEKKVQPVVYPAAQAAEWPPDVRDFHDAGEAESFVTAGNDGDRLDYMVRSGGDVVRYSMPLDGVSMGRLTDVYTRSRAVVDRLGNPRRGLFAVFRLSPSPCGWRRWPWWSTGRTASASPFVSSPPGFRKWPAAIWIPRRAVPRRRDWRRRACVQPHDFRVAARTDRPAGHPSGKLAGGGPQDGP